MNHRLKTVSNRSWLPLLLVGIIAGGCADVRGPTWLTGEPDESVLSVPRVVGTPSGAAKKEWPNLAEVPSQQPVFSQQNDRRDETVELNSDRLKAQAEMERIRNIQLEERTSEEDMRMRLVAPPSVIN